MPPGQTLGPKKKYKYELDDGSFIRLRLDSTLGDLAGTGLTDLTTADVVANKPTNFKPRVVFVSNVSATGQVIRKEIVCNPNGSLYKSNTNQNVTIDTVVFQTSGRRGEKYSF